MKTLKEKILREANKHTVKTTAEGKILLRSLYKKFKMIEILRKLKILSHL